MSKILISPKGPAMAGDFVVVAGHGFNSDVVEDFEGSKWTHVISVIDSTHTLDPQWPCLLERTGPVTADLTHAVVYVENLTKEERNSIRGSLVADIGRHYGLKALAWAGLTIIFPFLQKVHDPIKDAGVVCSTTLAFAYRNAGMATYNKLVKGRNVNPAAVTPAMLAEIWGVK